MRFVLAAGPSRTVWCYPTVPVPYRTGTVVKLGKTFLQDSKLQPLRKWCQTYNTEELLQLCDLEG